MGERLPAANSALRAKKMASHYRDAAKCLKAVDGGRTTLKTAAYKTQNPPRTVALVSEVRRHRKALETAIAATGLREKAGGDAQLLLVAVYDAVAGRGAPKRCGGKLLRAIREVLCGARINQSSRRWRAGGRGERVVGRSGESAR